jgi:hypothetical protein
VTLSSDNLYQEKDYLIANVMTNKKQVEAALTCTGDHKSALGVYAVSS